MICARLIIQTPPPNTPAHYLNALGQLEVDLPDDFSFRQSRVAEELNDLERIEIGGTLGFSINLTPKNDWIAQQKVDVQGMDRPVARYDVVAMNSGTPMRQNVLTFIDGDESSWNVELIDSEDHWLKIAETKKLQDCPLGEVDFTEANVLFSWNNPQYVDATVGVAFPPVSFGKLHGQLGQGTIVQDYRPHHHALYVLQQAFCAIGWKFRCPFLETDIGRKIITYILRDDYGQRTDLKELREFSVSTEGWLVDNGNIVVFDIINFDEGGNYNTTTGIAMGYGEYNFRLQGELSIFPNTISVTIKIEIEWPDGLTGELAAYTITNPGNDSVTESIDLLAENVLIPVGSKVYVKITGSVFAQFQGTFSSESISSGYIEGDTIDLASVIHPDYSLLDFLKGIQHLLKGKIDTRVVQREVWLYTPFDATVDGEDIEGYYHEMETGTDLRPYLTTGESIKVDPKGKKRYQLVSFKRGQDEMVAAMKLPEDQPLYSKIIDYGEGYEDGSANPSQNPLFEPTRNTIGFAFRGFQLCFLPHMVDNLNQELSFNIGARILIFVGFVDLSVYLPHGSGSPLSPGITLNGTDYDDFPYAYQGVQFTTAETDVSSALALWPDIPEFQLIYGEGNNDVFKKFWNRAVLEEFKSPVIERKALLHQLQFESWSFRNEFIAKYRGQDIVARLLSIEDFQGCPKGEVSLMLRPQLQDSTVCYDANLDPDLSDECLNFPTILFDYDAEADEYSFSSGGVVNSPILTNTWEWRFVSSDESWQTGIPLIVEPSESFFIRLTQAYDDGCPPVTVQILVDPCGNAPQLIVSTSFNESGQVVVTAEIGGIITSSYSLTITYTINDGAPAAYTDPLVDVSGVICFEATLDYDSACADAVLTKCISVPGEIAPDDIDGGANGYWVPIYEAAHSGTSYVVAGYGLPNPAGADEDYIKTHLLVYLNGRKHVYKSVRTQPEHYGINSGTNAIEWSFPVSGELEIYLWVYT